MQRILPTRTYNAAKALALSAGVAMLGVILVLLVGYVMASPTFGWTGLHALHLHTFCACMNRDPALATSALLTAGFSLKDVLVAYIPAVPCPTQLNSEVLTTYTSLCTVRCDFDADWLGICTVAHVDAAGLCCYPQVWDHPSQAW